MNTKELLSFYKNPFFMGFTVLSGVVITSAPKIISSINEEGLSFFTSSTFLISVVFYGLTSIGLYLLWYFGKDIQEDLEKVEDDKESEADVRSRYNSSLGKRTETYTNGSWKVVVRVVNGKWSATLYEGQAIIAEREL